MKKKNKTNKKKKGFTLVELLAVIIILAIVVGISIPAVLTTINTTRAKAFNTAAQSVANWVDRQYEVYTKGLEAYGVATLDREFKKLCVRGCGENGYVDYAKQSVDLTTGVTGLCGCDNRINYITNDFIIAAGLKSNNIKVGTVGNNKNQSIRIKNESGNLYAMRATTPQTTLSLGGANEDTSYTNGKSRVYIDASTGKSCVTLYASDNGDYPKGAIACGGTCKTGSANVSRPDYCEAK